METTIASYQEPGIRLQLVKIDEPERYQIRKNRKILCTFKWETPAKQKFEMLIREQLLQTSINFEEKKLYKITKGGRYFIEEREVTPNEYRSIVYNNQNNIGNPVYVTYTEDKRFITLKEITYEEYKKI